MSNRLYLSASYEPLDGSHEHPVVMTEEEFRKSHRVALLMPKVVFWTPRYKHWFSLLDGRDTHLPHHNVSMADYASAPGVY